MDKLVWSPQLSVGIPSMDAGHRAFIDEMGRLADLPNEEFGASLRALIAAMENDFREEEELMEKIDFSALQIHREQHARVLGALHRVVPGVFRGEYQAARNAIKLLPQWFLFHLSTMDAALAVAIEIAAMAVTSED
jgi:hemerythrin